MKKLLSFLLAIIVILVITVGIIYYMLGSIISTGVETVGPKATGGNVRLAHVNIDLFQGQAGLSGLVIGNPPGFTAKNAFTLKAVRVRIDKSTIMRNPIIIEDILIDGANITWEGLAGDNLKKITQNIKRFTNKTIGTTKSDRTPVQKKKSTPQKKIIINNFRFQNSFVHIVLGDKEIANIKLPDIYLKDIGKKEGGLSIEKAIERSYNEIMKDLQNCINDNQKLLIKKLTEYKQQGKKIIEEGKQSVKHIQENIEKGDIDSAVKGVLNNADKLKGIFDN